jgi:hypothetical protein
MYSINQPNSFLELKEFYLPAIHHPILVGKKKMYHLSVPIGGQEILVKKSIKKIKHTSFANVILGAVLRMKKIFQPEKMDLAVIITKRPNPNNLTLEFELVNRQVFKIGSDPYFLTIVGSYTYEKTDYVTYYPILYRQSCGNGAVTLLSEHFREIISVDKIFEIGSDWTRCNFEDYKNLVNEYFESLRRIIIPQNQLKSDVDRMVRRVLEVNRSSVNRKVQMDDYSLRAEGRDRIRASDLIPTYIEQFGNNQLAVWNALTDFASQEHNLRARNENLMRVGKYLSKEIKKMLKTHQDALSESMSWNEMIQKTI